jgi:hypothetical protein
MSDWDGRVFRSAHGDAGETIHEERFFTDGFGGTVEEVCAAIRAAASGLDEVTVNFSSGGDEDGEREFWVAGHRPRTPEDDEWIYAEKAARDARDRREIAFLERRIAMPPG